MQLIAVSLIGVPASGKTTFARKLLEMSKIDSLHAGVIVISFDDYIRMDFDEVVEGDYKRRREGLMMKIEDLIKNLRSNEHDRWPHDLKPEYNIKPDFPTLLIFDDNNYFRSMRQQVRALCRSHQCDHFQVFFPTKLDDALKNNRLRPSSVPESVIEKMFNAIEAPTNPRTVCMPLEDCALLQVLHDRIADPENLEAPTLPPKSPKQQSLIHEADIITRRELKTRIEASRSSSNFSNTCTILNRKRKEFLDTLRTQKVEFADADSLRAAFNCYLD